VREIGAQVMHIGIRTSKETPITTHMDFPVDASPTCMALSSRPSAQSRSCADNALMKTWPANACTISVTCAALTHSGGGRCSSAMQPLRAPFTAGLRLGVGAACEVEAAHGELHGGCQPPTSKVHALLLLCG
jgi:hypothetical protein